MTWTTKELENLVRKAKSLVGKEFKLSSSKLATPVFIAGKEELQNEVLYELKQSLYSRNAIRKIERYFLPFIIGKYFKLINEIWLLHGKGENIDTVIHELLHSIQKCEPNREGIVDFITYKITGSSQYVGHYELVDWQEIEKAISYHRIKKQLTSEGDCEDF